MDLRGINLPELMDLPKGTRIRLNKKTVNDAGEPRQCRAKFKKKKDNKWKGRLRITNQTTTTHDGVVHRCVNVYINEGCFTDHAVFEYLPHDDDFPAWKFKKLELILPELIKTREISITDPAETF